MAAECRSDGTALSYGRIYAGRYLLEHAANGTLPPDISDITERLERIERAVTGGHGSSGDQKQFRRSEDGLNSKREGTA